MVARVNTVAFQGVDVCPVDVQVQIASGMPAFTIVGSINPDVKKRSSSMYKFLCLSVLFLLFHPANVHAENKELPIDYFIADMKEPANSVVLSGNNFNVYGPSLYRKIPKTISPHDAPIVSYNVSGHSEFNGYVMHGKSSSDGTIILAGVHSQGVGMDTRQDFIAWVDPLTLKSKNTKYLNGRYATGLVINNDEAVLLSNSGDGYTLTIFGKNQKKKASIDFGSGGNDGGIAITPHGNYAVIGFDVSGDNYETPVYWEFTPELKLFQKVELGNRRKHSSALESIVQILTVGQEMWVMYGWPLRTSVQDEPNRVVVEHIVAKGLASSNPFKIPYKTGMKFFADKKGIYALYPELGHIKKLMFDWKSEKIQEVSLNRPLKPVQCFPPESTYEIIDVLEDDNKESFIAVSSRPLDSFWAGCVSIGKMKEGVK